MKLSPRIALLFTALVFLSAKASAFKAQDTSIDKLLKKLPPPEKLVQPRVQQAVRQSDSALNDPLSKRVFAASDAGDYRTALNLSRELVKNNPRSATANFIHGAFALDTDQFAEASSAFRTSIAAESNHGIVHLALGVSEMIQKRYAAALAPLQASEKLEPSWAAGWLLASQCEVQLHHLQSAVDNAKRATALEPSWIYTWLQL